jgi:hypothetical protein
LFSSLPRGNSAYAAEVSFVVQAGRARHRATDRGFGEYYGDVGPLDRKLAPEATPVHVMLGFDYPRFFALFKSLLTRP